MQHCCEALAQMDAALDGELEMTRTRHEAVPAFCIINSFFLLNPYLPPPALLVAHLEAAAQRVVCSEMLACIH
jgi:hypothetical protein